MAAAGADAALIDAVRERLAAAADPARAEPMRAYMKSSMPFFGVPSAGQKAIAREVFAAHPLTGFARWRATVLGLWEPATHREERYLALLLAGDRRYRDLRTPTALPLLRRLIVSGAWWDMVDPVATRIVGELLADVPDRVAPVLRGWSTDTDMWLRRSSIIAQVNAKARTDLELLYACIEPNRAEREFFIRKAIGWALRAYAWTDPDEISRYVASHELSGLSRREALKHISWVVDLSPGAGG